MKKGAKLLRALISPQVTQNDIVDRLGVTQQAVSAWVNGGSCPSYERRLKLEELYGIPLDSWIEDDETSETSSGDAA